MKVGLNFIRLLPLAFLFSCCEHVEVVDNKPPYEKPIPEIVRFTNLEITYTGDDIGDASSDLWELTFYTDMDIDEAGFPIGPGKLLTVSLNSKYSTSQEPNLTLLSGTYSEQKSSGDFSVGTFIEGLLYQIPLPDGTTAEMPRWSFYGDIPQGSTQFEPDLLREGEMSIEAATDGSLQISGILVGHAFTKRYFEFSGKPDKIITESPEVGTPNSNLTEDVTISGSVQCNITDKGDSFFVGDGSYKNLSAELTRDNSDGSNTSLKIEFLVAPDADKANGIPDGEYTVIGRNENGSVNKSDIVPMRIVSGAIDDFTYWSGSWYRVYEGGAPKIYARINEGKVTVSHIGGKCRMEIELYDCSSPAYKLSGIVEF